MGLSLVANGLIFLDTFARANSADVGNGWDETVRGSGLIKIQDNNLDSNDLSGIQQVYQPGDSGAAVVIPTGDTIVQINADMSLAGGDMCRLILRSDEIVAGTSARDEYFVHFEATTPSLKAVKVISNSEVATASDPFNVANDKRALRMIFKDQGGTHIITARPSAILSDLDDLTKDFDGASAELTDSSSVIEATGDTTDFAILTIDDVWMRHFIICGRNILVTGLPTGWKASADLGTTKATESSGTATIDVDTLALPRTSIDVYDGSDVLQDRLTVDVYGGGSLAFSSDIADPQVGPFSIGFNFRNSAGFVTDEDDEVHVGSADVYPVTEGGATWGWDTSFAVVPGHSDRDATVDRRLAGSASKSNVHTDKAVFRVDVGSGIFRISLAGGDTVQGTAHYELEIRDGVVLVLTSIVDTDGILLNEYYDATGVLRTEAAWPTGHLKLEATVNQGSLYIFIGAGDGVTGGTSKIAHLRIELLEDALAEGNAMQSGLRYAAIHPLRRQ